MLYVSISVLMAGAAVAWLVYDLCYSTGEHLDHLVVRRYAVRVWDPSRDRASTHRVQTRTARTLL